MPHVYRAALLLMLVGCYSPSYSNCTIACTDSCPNGLTCDSQLHMCRTSGTTCSPGGGDDAGGDSGGGDAVVGMDAEHDAPVDALVGCVLEQEIPGSVQGPNLVVDLTTGSSHAIPAGHFVVVAIAAHGPGSTFTVNDFNGNQLSQAVKTQYTDPNTVVTMTSAIYYFLAAPAQIHSLNVNFTNDVWQGVVIGDWKCSTPPSAQTQISMMNGPSTGNTTEAGSLAVASHSIVVGTIADAFNLPTLTTQGMALLDGYGFAGDNTKQVYSEAGWGVFDAGSSIDVSFSTTAGGPYAISGAAFTVP